MSSSLAGIRPSANYNWIGVIMYRFCLLINDTFYVH